LEMVVTSRVMMRDGKRVSLYMQAMS